MKIKKSISHFTGQEQHALYRIRKKLVKTLQPVLIWFLNSAASKTLVRNPPGSVCSTEEFRFKCTLLIVLPDDSPFAADETTLHSLRDSLAPVAETALIVYSLTRFREAVQTHAVPTYKFPQHAILLYEKDGLASQITPLFHKMPKQDPTNNTAKVSEGSAPGIQQEADDDHPPQDEPPMPFGSIKGFYACFGIDGAKEELDSWMQKINVSHVFEPGTASNLLFFYEYLCELVADLWEIHQIPEPARIPVAINEPGQDPILEPALYCSSPYAAPWDQFPRSLSLEEFINPYLALERVFQFKDLAEWQEALHEILHLAYSANVLEDLITELDLLAIRQCLDAMLDIGHLLVVRSAMPQSLKSTAGSNTMVHE